MPTKTVISPGQGLLLLIDHYKADLATVDQLKRLYLSGAVTPTNKQAIVALMSDPVLSSYRVSFDKRTINEDPSRRYFETHLSHATLAGGLSDENIKKEDLEQHVSALSQMVGPTRLSAVQHVLNGEFRESDPLLNKEFADFISKIKSGDIFSEITTNDNDKKEKIVLLVTSAFLGICNAQQNQLPLNIYGTGLYSEAQKGKWMLPDQETTRSQNLGTMKSYMPLAQDDIARTKSSLPYLKPSDQATFVENTTWVSQNFDRLVHPYSNSISGTMLCQLRSLAQFKNVHKADPSKPAAFTESPKQMGDFCKLLVSAMLFGSGGHTLYEFTAPLSLPEVRKEFSDVLGYEDITIETMFQPWEGSVHYSENQHGFEKALEETIHYNTSILEQANVRAQIKGELPFSPSELSKPVLFRANSSQLDQKKYLLIDCISGPPYIGLSNMIPPVQYIRESITRQDYEMASSQIIALKQAINSGQFPCIPSGGPRRSMTVLFSQLQEKVEQISVLKNQVTSDIIQKNRALKEEMSPLLLTPTLSSEQESTKVDPIDETVKP